MIAKSLLVALLVAATTIATPHGDGGGKPPPPPSHSPPPPPPPLHGRGWWHDGHWVEQDGGSGGHGGYWGHNGHWEERGGQWGDYAHVGGHGGYWGWYDDHWSWLAGARVECIAGESHCGHDDDDYFLVYCDGGKEWVREWCKPGWCKRYSPFRARCIGEFERE